MRLWRKRTQKKKKKEKEKEKKRLEVVVSYGWHGGGVADSMGYGCGFPADGGRSRSSGAPAGDLLV